MSDAVAVDPIAPEARIHALEQEIVNLKVCLAILLKRQGGEVILRDSELRKFENVVVPKVEYRIGFDTIHVRVKE